MKEGTLDRTDISLLHILMRDSRASEQQMSEVLNITPRGVYLRTETLVREGVVRAMTAKPSLASLGAKSVLIYGRSRLRSMQHAMSMLSGEDSVAWIAQSTGGRFYIAIHLKKDDDIDLAVQKTADRAMIASPVAAIRELFDIAGEYNYSTLDWRIVSSMSEDPRKSMEEVAAEIDEPLRRVVGRFNRMLERNALDLSIEFDPNAISNPLCLFHMECFNKDRIVDTVQELMRRHAPSILFFNTYSNMPHMMTSLAVLQDLEELRSVMRSFEETECFDHIDASLIIRSATMGTWRDKMVAIKGRPRALPQ
ncbi:MAG: winged helix-turn-helix transcriptional regulator [Methanomassiliicoccales archaeon]|nr:MAG: winged helix-turn-helix transcriptional regulator [Methanomassiliicoccales archaeon]